MIAIDFQGGAHGNFLEFVCNVAAGVGVDGEPFNKLGASHNKPYTTDPYFVSDHYFQKGKNFPSNKVVSIRITADDILPLSQISLLRAADYGYDNNQLEIDTYHKLNNPQYKWVLDVIVDSFFANQVKDSYNAVKDDSWPDVNSISDFNSLPEHIKQECIEVHNLKLFELSPEQPNCPREILREFFQLGFENPAEHGFMQEQQRQTYGNNIDVYNFYFENFYKTDTFICEVDKLLKWANLSFVNKTTVELLYAKFLTKQMYKDSKIRSDQIVQQLIDNKILPPTVTLIEEAYINAMLKKQGYERRY